MRLVVARCQVDYAGKLTAHLPMATRLLLVKNDGSVLVHSDGGSYKPLNWMNPPCSLVEQTAVDGTLEWLVAAQKTDDTLRIQIEEVLHDSAHDLGVDPGLQKDGVEKHLQELLAEHTASLGEGMTLVRREHMTAIGPVDLLCRPPIVGLNVSWWTTTRCAASKTTACASFSPSIAPESDYLQMARFVQMPRWSVSENVKVS